ncbi:hypothetical protein FALBO_7408 [Fusarium albosuccineum]|uniref:Uncharacterized protein n=1 Tax=Fusarium albosuccineum TaxID=1237068 RepID=A0A8H4LDL4_9HYPO|nr:hypothetical protein FALBO_7408 [Fusarium albosuccineum]
MCIKVTTACCHCGERLEPYWIACHMNGVLTNLALCASKPKESPEPGKCPYLKEGMRPLLSGCPNNDYCPSWFGTMFPGFGEVQYEDPYALERVAWEKYEGYQKRFAQKYFARQPLTPTKPPESFLALAQRDLYGDVEEYVQGDDLEEDQRPTDCGAPNAPGDQHHEPEDETVTTTTDTSGIDPEQLFYGDLVDDDDIYSDSIDSGAGEGGQDGREGQAEDSIDLPVPVWTWFYPADMGRDGEFCD